MPHFRGMVGRTNMVYKLEPMMEVDDKFIYYVKGMSSISVDRTAEVYDVYVPPVHHGNKNHLVLTHDSEGLPHLNVPCTNYDYSMWNSILSLGIDRRTLRSCKAIAQDDGSSAVFMSINCNGKGVFSQTRIIDFAYNLIDTATNREDVIMTDEIPTATPCPEMVALTTLVTSHDYIVTVRSLINRGINRKTASATMKSLVKRGLLVECGKRGRMIVYTSPYTQDAMNIYIFGEKQQ